MNLMHQIFQLILWVQKSIASAAIVEGTGWVIANQLDDKYIEAQNNNKSR